jgi:hypothetical protein
MVIPKRGVPVQPTENDYEYEYGEQDGMRKAALATSREPPWPEIVDRNLREALTIFRDNQVRRHEEASSNARTDKGILLIFGVALLSSLFFMFYLLASKELDSVTRVLYPVIMTILGFLSGYFAGTGRSRKGR